MNNEHDLKICITCNVEKPYNEFYFRKDSGKYRNECKSCVKKRSKIHKINNPQVHKEYAKKYRETHKKEEILRHKKYRENNREKISKYRKNYNKKTKYFQNRYKNDIIYRLKIQIRNTIKDSFSRRKLQKNKKATEILGCTIEEFIIHLKNTYKNNYGVEWNEKNKVHIDHIIPLSKAKNENDVIKLCHYTNLQLLKPKDNIQKKDKLNYKIKKEG